MSSVIRARTRTRLSAAERREMIVHAATQLIAQRGFWGMSIQDVADGCDLTVTGVLHHMKSKDGLLLAVLAHRDEVDAQSAASLLEVTPRDGTFEWDRLMDLIDESGVSLAALCRALVARNARQPEIVRLYSALEAESLNPEHPAHDYFAHRQQMTLQGFARLAPAGSDAVALARHVLAAMDGLQLQWLREPALDLAAEWERVSRRIGLTG